MTDVPEKDMRHSATDLLPSWQVGICFASDGRVLPPLNLDTNRDAMRSFIRSAERIERQNVQRALNAGLEPK